jgi:dihydrofolate reductase
LFSDEDYGYSRFYDSIDTFIMGRKTFDMALQLEEHPFKEKRCIVFSKNPCFNTWRKNDVETVNNTVGFVKELVTRVGKDIWLVGGSQIISTMINANLVDEII